MENKAKGKIDVRIDSWYRRYCSYKQLSEKAHGFNRGMKAYLLKRCTFYDIIYT